MVKTAIKVIAATGILSLMVMSCNGGGNGGPAPRPFSLGFTPFPYDTTVEAVTFTYDTLAKDADIIAHHFDDGIPWPEALASTPYHQDVQDEWNYRKANTPAGHKVYVAITPLNLARDGLALYRGASGDLPLPSPWDTYALNHPDVKTAYLNHAINVIEFFQPDYLAIGIEANLLLTNSPAMWPAYLELHQYVYGEVKSRYPNVPVMVSFFGIALLDGYRSEDDHTAQMSGFQNLINYTDHYAISLYPYMSMYLTDSIPDTMFDDLFSLSSKPIVIAETGYPAQTFSISDPVVGTLTFNTDEEKQRAYIAALLHEADQRQFTFVINFVLRDYDDLCVSIGGCTDTEIIWRDTGLYDENGAGRPALDVWRSVLARPRTVN